MKCYRIWLCLQQHIYYLLSGRFRIFKKRFLSFTKTLLVKEQKKAKKKKKKKKKKFLKKKKKNIF